MTGTLDAGSKATYTDPGTSTTWTYYQDSANSSIYYIAPVPVFAQQGGIPQFHLTEYDDQQGNFIAGQCQLTTALTVPPAIQSAVGQALQQKGVAAPNYQAMPFVDITPGGQQSSVDPNQAFLSYADAAGTVSRTLQTTPSLSGNQQAVFVIGSMSAAEVAFFKAYFGGTAGAGTVQVSYKLTVWALLNGVSARVQFDSQAAYTYQRTFKWVRG